MVILIKLGLKPEGYFTSLISNMSVYSDALQELGEMYSFLGTGGHPLFRILIATGTQTFLFVIGCIVSKLAGEDMSKLITDSIAQYIGAKPSPPQEKTYEERRIEAEEEKKKNIKQDPMALEPLPKSYNLPIDPTPMLGIGLDAYARSVGNNSAPPPKSRVRSIPYEG
jgi:hypothetical protein